MTTWARDVNNYMESFEEMIFFTGNLFFWVPILVVAIPEPRVTSSINGLQAIHDPTH